MRIVDEHTMLQNNGNTVTEQHLSEFFGKDVKNLGLYTTMNKKLVTSAITEALGNVYAKSSKVDKYNPINKMAFQWRLDKNYIKKIRIVQDADISAGLGDNREIFTMFLAEKYYNVNDTFALDNKTQCRVVATPVRITANKWSYRVVLVNNDLALQVDLNYVSMGKETIYRSNYYPELSERGYSKFVMDTELHRNYISLHRHSKSISQQAAATSKKYLESVEGDEGRRKKVYYGFINGEKVILDEFLQSRDNSQLWAITNFDVHGVCLDQDENGQDVPIGAGLIPQSEAYASRSLYSVMDVGVIKTALDTMTEKSDDVEGNTFVVICNKELYNQVGDALMDYTVARTTGNTFLYSESEGKVDIGATFASFEYQGNKMVFMIDLALTQEHPNYGYGIMLDMAPDANGRPAVQSFTLEGSEMLTGIVPGLGNKDGKTSGIIATGLTGTEFHIAGYSGIGLFNPYRSHIFKQNVI